MKSTIRNLFCAAVVLALCSQLIASAKDVVYLTPGLDLPFWRYLSKGVESVAKKEGYGYQAFDSHNDAQTQLKNAQDAIARGVAGIVISPTDSSTCPSVLALAQKANIPVVIADIGTNEGEYVSFIISDNREGAYGTGKALVAAMKEKDMTNGTVGLVTISLTRNNGKQRTAGFRAALEEGGLKESALEQMQNYTASETYKYVQDMLTANPNMKGIFIETDQPTMGALRAIKAARRVCRSFETRANRRLRNAATVFDGRSLGRSPFQASQGRDGRKTGPCPDCDRDEQKRRPDASDD
jgi:ribose transport system substrate-binding protein